MNKKYDYCILPLISVILLIITIIASLFFCRTKTYIYNLTERMTHGMLNSKGYY